MSTYLSSWAEVQIPGRWCLIELAWFSCLVFSCIQKMSGRSWEKMGPSTGVVRYSGDLNNQHPPTTGETREAWQFFQRKIASSLAEGKLLGNPNTNCPPQFFLMTSNRSFCPSPLSLVLSISIELFPSFFSMISKHRLPSTAPIYCSFFFPAIVVHTQAIHPHHPNDLFLNMLPVLISSQFASSCSF